MSAVRVVTEGRLDLAIATRLLEDRGAFAIPTGARNGRGPLLRRLRDYNAAAQRERWLVLFDLDKDECAPALLSEHLPSPASGMHVRVAAREVESWLLADSGLARYIRIPARTLPADVEAVHSPKRRLVELVRTHCRTKAVRSAMLPAVADAAVGEDYSDFLIDFVRHSWNPERAAERSDSLRRCLTALDQWTL